MSIDLFNTRTMIEAVEQMKRPTSFFRDTFFPTFRTFVTEQVDVDIVKARRRVAPFVKPGLPGKVVNRDGYSTKFYKAPMISEKMETNAEHLLKRLPGENIYSGVSPDVRAAKQLGQDLATLEDMILRRENLMAAEALWSGTQTIKGDGVDEVIDFGISATHKETLTSTALWSAYTTADPLNDLRRWRLQCIQDSGFAPDVCVMDEDAATAFIKNAEVQKLLDNRRIEMGQINPQELANGVTYIGRISRLGLDIYTYNDWYLDEATGTEKPFVPVKKVGLFSTQARYDRLYGAYIDMEMGTMDVPRIPRSWVEKDPSVRWVQMLSRPLFVPQHIDSLFIAQVLS